MPIGEPVPITPSTYNTSSGIGFVVPSDATATAAWRRPMCATEGHSLSEDSAELSDGTIVGSCITCGSRMSMGRIAGGLPMLQIRELMHLLDLAGGGMPLPETVKVEFMRTQDALRVERQALQMAEKAFAMVKAALEEALQRGD